MFNRHRRGFLPASSMDFKIDIVDEVFQAHFWIRFPLTIVDRADNLRDLAQCGCLRHFRHATQHLIAPMPVLPPLTNPLTFHFLNATFLEPFTHELNSFHASTVLITGSAASVASMELSSFASFQASRAARRTSFFRPRQMTGSGF